ncbi:hypothetical protein [Hoyosella altamirensis]|uniref:Uncharacterized protein n=1 Tax=Hoyosella altamirensis TaxID=616997 RepID=A0A839RPF4_9ACTN|nr:hypothetical protein [Hoyosella altamirensis]MBB3038675.1 hypothetical protein [Hoyosella altamirensis]
MTSSPRHSSNDLTEIPVLTDDDLHSRVAAIVGPAVVPQLWLLFFTPLGYQLPVVIPVQDPPTGLPRAEQCTAMVTAMKGAIWETGEDAAAVFVIERPDQTVITHLDQIWARRLLAAAATADLPVRGVFISLSTGVRPLPLTPG